MPAPIDAAAAHEARAAIYAASMRQAFKATHRDVPADDVLRLAARHLASARGDLNAAIDASRHSDAPYMSDAFKLTLAAHNCLTGYEEAIREQADPGLIVRRLEWSAAQHDKSAAYHQAEQAEFAAKAVFQRGRGEHGLADGFDRTATASGRCAADERAKAAADRALAAGLTQTQHAA